MNHVADKEHFEQPDKFIPERWLKENHDPKCPHAKDAHPFAFLPFGFGSRMCIGKRFADLEMEVLTARYELYFKNLCCFKNLNLSGLFGNFKFHGNSQSLKLRVFF